MTQVFIFKVNLVSLLNDFAEGFLVFLPQVFITLLFTKKGVDELMISSFEVHLSSLTLL